MAANRTRESKNGFHGARKTDQDKAAGWRYSSASSRKSEIQEFLPDFKWLVIFLVRRGSSRSLIAGANSEIEFLTEWNQFSIPNETPCALTLRKHYHVELSVKRRTARNSVWFHVENISHPMLITRIARMAIKHEKREFLPIIHRSYTFVNVTNCAKILCKYEITCSLNIKTTTIGYDRTAERDNFLRSATVRNRAMARARGTRPLSLKLDDQERLIRMQKAGIG